MDVSFYYCLASLRIADNFTVYRPAQLFEILHLLGR